MQCAISVCIVELAFCIMNLSVHSGVQVPSLISIWVFYYALGESDFLVDRRGASYSECLLLTFVQRMLCVE